jgi:hypothetical protein
MRKIDSTKWAHGIRDFAWYLYGSDIVSSTDNSFSLQRPYNSVGTATIDTQCSALLFAHDLGEDSSSEFELEETDRPKLLIMKDDKDYNNNSLDMTLDSRLDTFKVFYNGDLSISASSVTLAAGNSDSSTTNYSHGLGYAPFFTPMVAYKVDLGTIGVSPIPTNINVNDFEDSNIDTGGAAILTGEVVYVYVDTDKIYLKFERTNNGASSHTFPARNISMNFTIFYNSIDEEFNLLE